ncbi:hypothetical protein [Desulfobulbus alkaliphilus]|uniref:hypothetical protein n=1 Tax=Desulfobulbus alkaliphilus TaxID=869814 RepID=UPI001965819B|nr:hypothetical protein [Desulfobulbus alkaliphilus]MBM9538059.1 hypothetical protein [Desulfobulbus alkaliphilus]
MKTGTLLCSLLALAVLFVATPTRQASASDVFYVRTDLGGLFMAFTSTPQHTKRIYHPPPPPPRHYKRDKGRHPIVSTTTTYHYGPPPCPPPRKYSRPKYYTPPPRVHGYNKHRPYRHYNRHHPHAPRYRR